MTALWRCVKYDPLLKHLFVRKQQNGCGKNLSNLKNYKRTIARVITEILKQSLKKSAPNTIHTGGKLFSQLPLLKNRELFLFGHLSGLGDLFAFGWVCFGVVGSWCWLGLFQLVLWLVPSGVPCRAGSGACGFIMVGSWSLPPIN